MVEWNNQGFYSVTIDSVENADKAMAEYNAQFDEEENEEEGNEDEGED